MTATSEASSQKPCRSCQFVIVNCWIPGNKLGSIFNQIFWHCCQEISGELFNALYSKLWHVCTKLLGGIMESITRLWLTQRATVHPLNAPSATTVGPKAPSCQPVSTHAWWWVTLKAKGPVTPLQPLSERLDEVNLWANTSDNQISVCRNLGRQRRFSTCLTLRPSSV